VQENHRFDVIVLGSSISSTSMASVLCAQGFRVLILDESAHPRFAIGESMLPQTSMWMWIVGERFGVPELKNLAHAHSVQREVSKSCGVKRAIGFVYHRNGQEHIADEGHQLVPPETPLFAESHLFREEVDHYLLRVAQAHGAEYREHSPAESVELSDDGVSVVTKSGERFEGRFLVDGTGGRSVLAKSLGLRDEPARQRTRSRSIFNHFKGVGAFDDVTHGSGKMGRRWHEGTLHHVFDGGWMWVIPFDNHSDAKNRLCSVGLMLREDRFPKTGMDPAEEFQSIVSQFPSVAAHFASAEPIRNWVSSGRIQYSSSRAAGARYALLSNTYAFIDPLYSTGLLSTFEGVHALTVRLIDALREDSFSEERFAYFDRLSKHQIDEFDKLVFNAYRAMSSFETWNAWTQYWLATVVYGDTYVFGHCLRYLANGNLKEFDALEESPGPKAEAPFAAGMCGILDEFDSILGRAEAGELEWAEAGEAMLATMRSADWLPKQIYNWGDPASRHVDFNPVFENWLKWGMTESPTSFQRDMFNFDPSVLARISPPSM